MLILACSSVQITEEAVADQSVAGVSVASKIHGNSGSACERSCLL
jgi:hypothetical protein